MLILGWLVGVGDSYHVTCWRPNWPPGGTPKVKYVLFLSCLWANLADTVEDIRADEAFYASDSARAKRAVSAVSDSEPS